MTTAPLDNLSHEKVRRILNVLAEAPFFYQSDDPDLFAFLRKHRSEFQRFYQEWFGWQLIVDKRGGRLFKDRWENPALRPYQHDVFDLTRRDDIIAFLIILEFHEHLLEEHNTSVDDPDPLRFQFGELFAFAHARFREVLGEGAPDEDTVRRILRGVMPPLLRYRFLREIEPEREDRDHVERENMIYECLPALWQYDVRALGPNAVAAALAGLAGSSEVRHDPHDNDR